MVRIWISRPMLVWDPVCAAHDASNHALAIELCRSAGLDYALREDETHAEAFMTGTADAAEQALADLDASGIPVLLVEVTDKVEANRLSYQTASLDGGDVAGGTSEYGRHCKLDLVTEFRR